MVSTEVGLEVLIPLAVLLIILIGVLCGLVCKFYLWEKCCSKKKGKFRHVSSCVSPKGGGHPYLPAFKAQTVPVQMKYGDQHSVYRDLSQTKKKKYSYTKIPADEGIHFDFDKFTNLRSEPSEASFTSDTSHAELSPVEKTVPSKTSWTLPNRPVRKMSRQRALSRSENSLSTLINEDVFSDTVKEFSMDRKSRKLSTSNRKLSSASATMSLISPVGGQVEFGLFYDLDTKSLEININQLLDLTLDPENFLGILEVYDKNDKIPKACKAYLRRNHHHVLELVTGDEIGFFVHVTLLPKKTFRKHTNIVFGSGNIVFNEKISITGYSLEHLTPFFLCFHALCKFGKDGEPIVLGEVKVPLKKVQVGQDLPFMANLGSPEEELELLDVTRQTTNLGDLEIYLSFNPIAQKLIVKIIQARNLPKYGMTGQPNVSVKVSLYFCNSRRNKKRTSIQKKQRNPVFNESFQFDLSRERLPDCDVVFELRHHGPMYRTPIGYVVVGNNAGGEGTQHWLQLLDFSYHEKVHKILPNKPQSLT